MNIYCGNYIGSSIFLFTVVSSEDVSRSHVVHRNLRRRYLVLPTYVYAMTSSLRQQQLMRIVMRSALDVIIIAEGNVEGNRATEKGPREWSDLGGHDSGYQAMLMLCSVVILTLSRHYIVYLMNLT